MSFLGSHSEAKSIVHEVEMSTNIGYSTGKSPHSVHANNESAGEGIPAPKVSTLEAASKPGRGIKPVLKQKSLRRKYASSE